MRFSHSGKPLLTSFWMKPFSSMPFGKRSIVIGRRRRCGSINGATAS
jgi:hypothetical protein